MREQETDKILLIGIGNSARQDDGLGWDFLEQVEKAGFLKGNMLKKFQLNLEDAELISQYDRVIFVDATYNNLEKGYSFEPCVAKSSADFSTHMLAPECTLYVCQQLYQQQLNAWILAIQGYAWELEEGMTPKAQENLQKAFKAFQDVIKQITSELSSQR